MNNTRNIPMYLTNYGELLLQLKTTHFERFLSTTFSFDQFQGQKENLPLLDGFIRKSGNVVAALVTLDVDTEEGQEALKKALNEYKGDLPIFTSTSHSGNLKAHIIVEIAQGKMKGDKFYRTGKDYVYVKAVASRLAVAIGLDTKHIDFLGISRCYLTESLYWKLQDVRETVKASKIYHLANEAIKERAATLAKKSLDESQVMIQKRLEAEANKEIVRGWTAKTEEYQANKAKNLEAICDNIKEFVNAHIDEARAIWGEHGLSDNALALLLIFIAAHQHRKSWLSSAIGEKLFGLKQYYSARKELVSIGMMDKVESYTPHLKATIFWLHEGIVEYTKKFATKVVLFVGSVSSIVQRFLENGGGQGSFNSLEVSLCVHAVRNGLTFDEIACKLLELPDWACEQERRLKRLMGTFRWASKKVTV